MGPIDNNATSSLTNQQRAQGRGDTSTDKRQGESNPSPAAASTGSSDDRVNISGAGNQLNANEAGRAAVTITDSAHAADVAKEISGAIAANGLKALLAQSGGGASQLGALLGSR